MTWFRGVGLMSYGLRNDPTTLLLTSSAKSLLLTEKAGGRWSYGELIIHSSTSLIQRSFRQPDDHDWHNSCAAADSAPSLWKSWSRQIECPPHQEREAPGGRSGPDALTNDADGTRCACRFGQFYRGSPTCLGNYLLRLSEKWSIFVAVITCSNNETHIVHYRLC